MKITKDLHTHTVYSHGKGTIEDNVKVGIEKGLQTIAISDHGPDHLGFGIKVKDIPKMREEIDQLNLKYPEIEILLAIEANVLGRDGYIDVYEDHKKYYDVILCGYHFGSNPKNFFKDGEIHLLNFLYKFTKIFEKRTRELNTESVCHAIERNRIDILTHPGAKGPIDILEVAKVAEKNGTLLEINNSHGHLTEDEMKICMQTDVKYIIGSDAHRPEDVGRFENSLIRINNVGLNTDNVVNLSKE